MVYKYTFTLRSQHHLLLSISSHINIPNVNTWIFTSGFCNQMWYFYSLRWLTVSSLILEYQTLTLYVEFTLSPQVIVSSKPSHEAYVTMDFPDSQPFQSIPIKRKIWSSVSSFSCKVVTELFFMDKWTAWTYKCILHSLQSVIVWGTISLHISNSCE